MGKGGGEGKEKNKMCVILEVYVTLSLGQKRSLLQIDLHVLEYFSI